jgi:FkbM family methyltransferase
VTVISVERRDVMDPHVMARFAAYEGPLARVLDIGACHGVLSMAAARRGAETVFAIEPNTNNFMSLMQNVRQRAAIYPICAAVGPVSGEIVKIRSAGNAGQSGMVYLEGYPVVCATVTIGINELLAQFRPDYIKVDVEGAEWDIFRALEPGMLDGVAHFDVELHDLGNSQYFAAGREQFDIAGKLRDAGFLIEDKPGASGGCVVASLRQPKKSAARGGSLKCAS